MAACPIWGSDARLEPARGDFEEYYSLRAGGMYRLVGSALPAVRNLSAPDKAKLTTWLVDQRRGGELSPLVNSEVLADIRAKRTLTVGERKERFIRALIASGIKVGGRIKIAGVVDDNTRFWVNHLASWTEAADEREVSEIAHLLAADGVLEAHPSSGTYKIASAGWAMIDSLGGASGTTHQAFVAMWFSDEMVDAFREGIAPAIADAGYLPFRIDGKEHNNKIDDEIIAEIKRSRFVVADFTCGSVVTDDGPKAIPRGGVYYEAGFAKGLGREVIYTCRADQIADIHFDTRQIAHVIWSTPSELRERLYNRIAATVGETPNAPGRGNSS